MKKTTRLAVLLFCFVGLSYLSGCGGGDDTPPSTPTNVWDDGSGTGNVLLWDDGTNNDNMKWEN